MLRLSCLVLVLCHTVLATASVLEKPEYDVDDLDLVLALFDNFIDQYERSYSPKEKIQRLQYFKQSLVSINNLNKDNPHAVFDIHKFADWSPEELKNYMGYKSDRIRRNICVIFHSNKKAATGDISSYPDSYDYRDDGFVTPVKDQQKCGSCWAFSATGNIESQYAIRHKKQVILSEQQLVDCDPKSHGCNGGLMTNALAYLVENGGQELEVDYPYVAKNGQCKFNDSRIAAEVPACAIFDTKNEDAPLKEILYDVGPLAIGVDAEDMVHYKNGIITSCTYTGLDHGVLLTGYGSENGVDFWSIKNSWGASYGEKGYVRIKRGVKCMGIGQDTSSAVVR